MFKNAAHGLGTSRAAPWKVSPGIIIILRPPCSPTPAQKLETRARATPTPGEPQWLDANPVTSGEHCPRARGAALGRRLPAIGAPVCAILHAQPSGHSQFRPVHAQSQNPIPIPSCALCARSRRIRIGAAKHLKVTAWLW